MKTKFFSILIVCLFFMFYAEGQINLQQIETTQFEENFLRQTIDPKQKNVANITQVGNQNRSSISQSNRNDMALGNQASTFQIGDWHQSSVTQYGSGNALLSYQLSYVITNLTPEQIPASAKASYLEDFKNENNVGSIGNNLTSVQEGTDNQILAVQIGTNNQISSTQKGQYNYLSILQQGTNNQLTDYKQINNSSNGLYDAIVQIGENLKLNVPDASEGRLHGNSYSQEGSNLSLTVNNSLVNTLGGMKVLQTGHDMHIEINQSFFSLPMK